MKKLFAILIVLFFTTSAIAGMVVGSGSSGGDACTGCTTASDTDIDGSENSVTAETSSTSARARFVTFASEKCVTGFWAEADSNGTGGQSITCELWDVSTHPTSIADAAYTATQSLATTGTPRVEMALSSPEVVPAGSYALVCQGGTSINLGGGSQVGYGRDGAGSGTYEYYSGSWQSSTYKLVIGVMGCE